MWVLRKMFGFARAPEREGLSEPLIDPSSRTVTWGGKSTRLEPRAFSVLQAVVAGKGQPVARDELLDRCWSDGFGSDEALTQAVAQIRRALGEGAGNPRFIVTIPKFGYGWKAPEPGSTRPRSSGGSLMVSLVWLAAGCVLLAASALSLLFFQPRAIETVTIKKTSSGTMVERRWRNGNSRDDVVRTVASPDR